MTFIEALLTSFFLSGAWLALIVFLGRSLLANLLAKDLEKLKGNIAAQNIEKQIVLGRLHEKRADALSNIYQGLKEYESKCRNYVFKAGHVDEGVRGTLLEELGNAATNFKEIFQNNHLYIRKTLCEKIENVFKSAQMPAYNFIFALGAYVGKNTTEEQYREQWVKAYTHFKDNMPDLLEELEKEFRLLLGVEESESI